MATKRISKAQAAALALPVVAPTPVVVAPTPVVVAPKGKATFLPVPAEATAFTTRHGTQYHEVKVKTPDRLVKLGVKPYKAAAVACQAWWANAGKVLSENGGQATLVQLAAGGAPAHFVLYMVRRGHMA